MTQVGIFEESRPTRWTSGVRILSVIGFVAVVSAAAIADYLSSWLPKLGGFPAGAVLRDGAAITFVALAGAVVLHDRPWPGRALLTPRMSLRSVAVAGATFAPFAAFSVWVLVLVPTGPAVVPAVLATRNLVLYAMVGFAAYVLVARRYLPVGVLLGVLTAFGFVAAGLGILDTVTHGAFVTWLGYRPDYSGVEGGASQLIAGASAAFQGFVRASGGISNALVFGYVMVAITVFAIWMLGRVVTRSGWRSWSALLYLALGTVAAVACIDSLTRGALIALALGLLVLILLQRSRVVLLGSLATVALALTLTWASSGLTSMQSAGSAMGLGLFDTVGTRVTSSDPTSQESSSLRLGQLRLGLEALAARPMGNGLGTEGAAADRAAGKKMAPDIFAMVVALQTGLVGAVLYALIFAAMILWSVRGPTRARALVLAMLGIFATSAVLSASPDAPVFATIMWILILAVSAVPALDDRAVADHGNSPPSIIETPQVSTRAGRTSA